MNADRFPIKPEDHQFRKLWQDGHLIVQDAEFVQAMGSAPTRVTEICWGWYDRGDWYMEDFSDKDQLIFKLLQVFLIFIRRLSKSS